MKLTDERTAGAHVVRSFAPGQLRVGEQIVTTSCLISASQLITDWRPTSVETLELREYTRTRRRFIFESNIGNDQRERRVRSLDWH